MSQNLLSAAVMIGALRVNVYILQLIFAKVEGMLVALSFALADSIEPIILMYSIIWALTRENLSSMVCKQQRRRPACASAQSDQRLYYSFIGKYHI